MEPAELIRQQGSLSRHDCQFIYTHYIWINILYPDRSAGRKASHRKGHIGSTVFVDRHAHRASIQILHRYDIADAHSGIDERQESTSPMKEQKVK
jgi:hypothetical protein